MVSSGSLARASVVPLGPLGVGSVHDADDEVIRGGCVSGLGHITNARVAHSVSEDIRHALEGRQQGVPFPGNNKRNLWHMDVALTTFYMGRFTPTLPTGLVMANTPYMPNFSLLGLPMTQVGPVAHGRGPDHLQHG